MSRSTTRATIRMAAILVLACCATFAATAATSSGEWTGTIGAVSGDDLALVGVADRFRLAGGVTERLSGRSLSVRELAPGSSVTLRVGEREADGRFRVDAVVLQPKNPLTLTGEIGQIGDDRRHVEVHGSRIEIDDHTAFSGPGASGNVRSARDLRVGMTVRAALVVTGAGVLQASEMRAMGASTEPGEDQEFRGSVVSISDTSWTIDDRAFAVNDRTVFRGDPGVGDFVEVKFHLDASGNAVADRIAKEDEAPGIEVEFMGIVEAIGDSSWTISGRVVGIDAATEILGNPVVGDNVEVEAHRAPDGTLTAKKIKKEDAAEQEVEFTGIVQSIGVTAWKIDSKTVLVNAATEIRDNPAVGDRVEVRALADAQGVLTATRIKKEDGDNQGEDHGNDAGDDHGDNSGSGNSGSSNSGHRGHGDDPSGDD